MAPSKKNCGDNNPDQKDEQANHIPGRGASRLLQIATRFLAILSGANMLVLQYILRVMVSGPSYRLHITSPYHAGIIKRTFVNLPSRIRNVVSRKANFGESYPVLLGQLLQTAIDWNLNHQDFMLGIYSVIFLRRAELGPYYPNTSPYEKPRVQLIITPALIDYNLRALMQGLNINYNDLDDEDVVEECPAEKDEKEE